MFGPLLPLQIKEYPVILNQRLNKFLIAIISCVLRFWLFGDSLYGR